MLPSSLSYRHERRHCALDSEGRETLYFRHWGLVVARELERFYDVFFLDLAREALGLSISNQDRKFPWNEVPLGIGFGNDKVV